MLGGSSARRGPAPTVSLLSTLLETPGPRSHVLILRPESLRRTGPAPHRRDRCGTQMPLLSPSACFHAAFPLCVTRTRWGAAGTASPCFCAGRARLARGAAVPRGRTSLVIGDGDEGLNDSRQVRAAPAAARPAPDTPDRLATGSSASLAVAVRDPVARVPAAREPAAAPADLAPAGARSLAPDLVPRPLAVSCA